MGGERVPLDSSLPLILTMAIRLGGFFGLPDVCQIPASFPMVMAKAMGKVNRLVDMQKLTLAGQLGRPHPSGALVPSCKGAPKYAVLVVHLTYKKLCF